MKKSWLGVWMVWIGLVVPVWSASAEGAGVVQKATVYKSPLCGCCTGYVEFLKSQGYEVAVENLADVEPVKRAMGVPAGMDSCHTTRIGGYVVEGHVPLNVLERLLREKPAIPGIALPGMPTGVPGMPGPKERLVIYTLENPPKVYAVEE